jgi:hypothetical protein
MYWIDRDRGRADRWHYKPFDENETECGKSGLREADLELWEDPDAEVRSMTQKEYRHDAWL